MNSFRLNFCNTKLDAIATGAVFWPEAKLLVVSDLHLGKSERIARRSGQLLPPYETRETLQKLDDAITVTNPRQVICLGDSFDDLDAADALSPEIVDWIHRLMAGRRWIWIEGNHDPGPLQFGGTHQLQFSQGALTFRHIAAPDATPGEVSGHYHPKAQFATPGRKVTRPCFLVDETRLILPAFGTYTGGLRSDHAVLSGMMSPSARAILTGPTPCEIPMPR